MEAVAVSHSPRSPAPLLQVCTRRPHSGVLCHVVVGCKRLDLGPMYVCVGEGGVAADMCMCVCVCVCVYVRVCDVIYLCTTREALTNKEGTALPHPLLGCINNIDHIINSDAALGNIGSQDDLCDPWGNGLKHTTLVLTWDLGVAG